MTDEVAHQHVDDVIVDRDHCYTGRHYSIGYQIAALVLAAVLTSQLAGAWLEYVLRRGWPLLSSDKNEAGVAIADVTVAT